MATHHRTRHICRCHTTTQRNLRRFEIPMCFVERTQPCECCISCANSRSRLANNRSSTDRTTVARLALLRSAANRSSCRSRILIRIVKGQLRTSVPFRAERSPFVRGCSSIVGLSFIIVVLEEKSMRRPVLDDSNVGHHTPQRTHQVRLLRRFLCRLLPKKPLQQRDRASRFKQRMKALSTKCWMYLPAF